MKKYRIKKTPLEFYEIQRAVFFGLFWAHVWTTSTMPRAKSYIYNLLKDDKYYYPPFDE